LKFFLLIWALIFFTAQIKNIFYIKTYKELLDNDKFINTNKDLSLSTTIAAAFIILLYYFLCGVYVNTFIFSIVCFVYCVWTIFDIKNETMYLNKNKISSTLNSKLYKIISKPFKIGFSLYMIYFIAMHW